MVFILMQKPVLSSSLASFSPQARNIIVSLKPISSATYGVAELMGVKGLNYLSTWIEVTSSNSFSYNLKGTIAIISVLQEYSGMSFSVVIDMDSVVTLHDDNIYGLSYSLTGTTFKLSASSGIHGLRFRILELQS